MAGNWRVSFRSSESLRDAERHHAPPASDGESCSRGAYCAGRVIIAEGTGRRIEAARAYGPFCPSCENVIRDALGELPAAYVRLEMELGRPPAGGAGVRATPGPRLPLRADVDWLQRAMSEVLASWHERVATAAQLSVVDTQESRRVRAGVPVERAVRVLSPRMSVLLALPAEPMLRSLPLRSHIAPDSVTTLILGGQDAGDEILELHRRCRRLLGETVRRREPLPGVPCRRCESFSLERAEPPSDPAREAMYACCAECRHEMSRSDYEGWAAWYSRWADGLGLACRRCQLGCCEECSYQKCACSQEGHAPVTVAA